LLGQDRLGVDQMVGQPSLTASPGFWRSPRLPRRTGSVGGEASDIRECRPRPLNSAAWTISAFRPATVTSGLITRPLRGAKTAATRMGCTRISDENRCLGAIAGDAQIERSDCGKDDRDDGRCDDVIPGGASAICFATGHRIPAVLCRCERASLRIHRPRRRSPEEPHPQMVIREPLPTRRDGRGTAAVLVASRPAASRRARRARRSRRSSILSGNTSAGNTPGQKRPCLHNHRRRRRGRRWNWRRRHGTWAWACAVTPGPSTPAVASAAPDTGAPRPSRC
jgi:hypothetical protein